MERKPRTIYIVDGKKWCAHCEGWLPVEYFSKRTSSLTGLQSWCKPCNNSYKAKGNDTVTEITPAQVARAIVASTKAPLALDHTHANDCPFTCPVCGMGVDRYGAEFRSQAEADTCCENVPAHVEDEHTLGYLRAGVLRKYNNWACNSSRVFFGQTKRRNR